MGAVSTFIRDLDPQKEVERDLKETMAILVRLAQEKLKGFKIEMNSSWTTSDAESLAPGVTKDFQDEQMRVSTSTDSEGMKESISKTVDAAFALGNSDANKSVSAFIKQLVSVGLDSVLGSGAAAENELKQYIIYPDGNFICRCDCWFWRYTMQSSGFQTKAQNVIVYRMQYGAVDINKVDETALGHWFRKWNIDTELMQKALDEARAILNRTNSKLEDIEGKRMYSLSLSDQRASLLSTRGILVS